MAGRIGLRRGQGKVNFLELRDWTGRIQIFVGKNQVGEVGWSLAGELDLGDLIGVDGTLGWTKTGELTVFADGLTMLAKSLLPPPEKWHGLTDIEQRYRQRYVDLFSNPDSMATLLGRSKVVAAFRKVLGDRGFVEVETPTMQSIAGGAAARPFVTHHNALDIDLFLRIAPELYLKRLLVGGMERVFEIGRVYRNEGISPKHNPEFTMLEAYQAYGDYHAMMDLTEAPVVGSIEALGGGFVRPWGETTIDFTPPWPRVTYDDLVRQHAGFEPDRPRRRPRQGGVAGDPHGRHRPRRPGQRDLRTGRRGPARRPRLRRRLPGGDLPADQAEGGRPAGRRAVRAVRPGDGAGQRLHRAERPALAGSRSSAGNSPGRRPRTRWRRWTTTSSGP